MHRYEIQWQGVRFWIAAHDAQDAERRVQAHLQAEGVLRSAWEASVIETDTEEDPVLSSR